MRKEELKKEYKMYLEYLKDNDFQNFYNMLNSEEFNIYMRYRKIKEEIEEE